MMKKGVEKKEVGKDEEKQVKKEVDEDRTQKERCMFVPCGTAQVSP